MQWYKRTVQGQTLVFLKLGVKGLLGLSVNNMDCHLESLLVVGLLICTAAAEVSRDINKNQEIQETRERFCGLSYEQKSTAVHCVINGFPAMAREWVAECSQVETSEESTRILVEAFSTRCTDGPVHPSPKRTQFRECLQRKEEENPHYIEQFRELGEDYVQNMINNCVNQAATGPV